MNIRIRPFALAMCQLAKHFIDKETTQLQANLSIDERALSPPLVASLLIAAKWPKKPADAVERIDERGHETKKAHKNACVLRIDLRAAKKKTPP